ncbi:MAG: TSUP family transporter [Labilithrix sp.]|nr:TSUP family transporter [Labilithrix sp.]MCW5811858.1 TSUP family transporter [Labilithrix sp.]
MAGAGATLFCMTLAFLLLGLAAGVLTTVAGQGGGLMLLLAVSALVGPHAALAITAPALLFGNLHRAVLLRHAVRRDVAVRLAAGALPGALAGGLAAGVLPVGVLRGIMVVLTTLAIAKALGWIRFTVAPRALGPAGFGLGILTGASGGAGILLAPILLALGLGGRAYVATSAVVAVAMHVGRVAGYVGLGFFSPQLVGWTVAVTVAIFAGNALGGRAQGFLEARGRLQAVFEYGTLIVCVALSVAGLG